MRSTISVVIQWLSEYQVEFTRRAQAGGTHIIIQIEEYNVVKMNASDTGLTLQCSARLGMSQRALQGPGKVRRKQCPHYKTGEQRGE